MQGAPRRDGEPHRMSESGAVAKREVGRVHNGLKREPVHERASLVFKKYYPAQAATASILLLGRPAENQI
jgi:hypothetical protein